MIINYLTWLRNKVGKSSEEISPVAEITTVSDLLDFLENKGSNYQRTFKNRNVIYAEINGQIVEHDTKLNGISQISFFGPVAGG